MITIEENVSLAPFTSWKVGGVAQYYVAPKTENDLKEAMLWAHQNQQPTTLLGGGTNVLVSDRGIQGLLVHTHKYTGVEVDEKPDRLVVTTLAGTSKAEALKVFLKYRLAPAVFLAGLPGDVGGGVVMNAGVGTKTTPKEFCEITESIEVFECREGEIITKNFTHSQIEWVYRKSNNWQPGIISKVSMSWPMEPNDQVLKDVREGNKRRKDTQPLNWPSCGSVFKNPPGHHSGMLIDQAGLKGKSIGGAQVSEKHANFIINTGEATAQDIHELIQFVKSTIKEKNSIDLIPEAVYLGEW